MYIEYRMILNHKTIGIENEKVLQDMDLKNPDFAIVARENHKTIKRLKGQGKGVCEGEGFMFRVCLRVRVRVRVRLRIRV